MGKIEAAMRRRTTLALLATALLGMLPGAGAWARQQSREPIREPISEPTREPISEPTSERTREPMREPGQQPAPEVDTEKEEYAKLPPCKLSDDGRHLAEEPCRTAKAREPVPRRPVPQAIERVSPAESKPVGPAPGATVLPTPPRQPPVTPATPGARPGAPIPTAGCDAGGCYGPGGQRYNNGPGATVVSPGGKLCSRNGAWIQC